MRKLNLILPFLIVLIFFSCETAKEPVKNEISVLIDNWHKAATNADLESFFGMMSDDAIYIGTDPGERWTRQEFYQFCEPYFSKGKAWDFKPYDRQIHFSEDNGNIWFDELLETWMGVCRGSGVIVRENDTYKISHYHLSVTIKNESIKEFLEIKQD